MVSQANSELGGVQLKIIEEGIKLVNAILVCTDDISSMSLHFMATNSFSFFCFVSVV